MRILYERHIPPKYVAALDARHWATLESTSTRFHPEAEDVTIAQYAASAGWVLFTRDRDFFELAASEGCGLLYLDMSRDPEPWAVVRAIEIIDRVHADYADIAESVPGEWV